MTENAEIGYWQAVVDDQRVANERISDELAEARAEIARLREIVAAAALYIALLDQRGEDALKAFDKLADLVNTYIEAKNT